MSQSVHLDMEVLQRIKFLMEYDVMKTSSENILLEQASMVDTSLRKGSVIPSTVKPPVDFSKLPDTSADLQNPKSTQFGNIPDVTLEEVTQSVRKFMSDWKVATVEAFIFYLGVGAPITITANAFWMTLEIIQLAKGTPSWWDLVFSIFATLTAGSQAAVLKPLYRMGGQAIGKVGNSLGGVLNYLYELTKNSKVWGKLKPLFQRLKSGLSPLLKSLSEGIQWISSKVKFKDSKTTSFLKQMLEKAKSLLSKGIDDIDSWFVNLMTKSGVNPEIAKKLPGAVRVAGLTAGAFKGVPYILPKDRPFLDSEDLSKIDDSEWDYN